MIVLFEFFSLIGLILIDRFGVVVIGPRWTKGRGERVSID